jgi:hypothetical protein
LRRYLCPKACRGFSQCFFTAKNHSGGPPWHSTQDSHHWPTSHRPLPPP